MKHYVGIDWSSQYDDICIINEKEEVVKEFKIEISKNDFDFLDEYLKKLPCRKSNIFIGIETDKNIVAEFLLAKGYNVYSLNPLCVHRFKQMYSPTSKKDDKYDAKCLALILLKDKNNFNVIYKSSQEIEELRIHIDTEEIISKKRTRIIQQLRNALSLYFPVFSEFFIKFTTSVPVNLLKYINNPSQIDKLSYAEYLALIADVKYMTSKRKEDFYKLLKEKAIDLKSPTVKPLCIRVGLLVEELILINRQLDVIKLLIEDIFNKHYLSSVFSSLPSAGEILAPKLLSHFGDNQELFSSYQSVQCYSGTAPVTAKSGKYLNEIKMRRACKKSFRNTLHQFSFCSIKSEQWAREYYDKLKGKGKSHSMAIRSLSNKWVKIIFRMWKNNEAYDAEIFLNSRKKHIEKGKKNAA